MRGTVLKHVSVSTCCCIPCSFSSTKLRVVLVIVCGFFLLWILTMWQSTAIVQYKDSLSYSFAKAVYHRCRDWHTKNRTAYPPHLTVRSAYMKHLSSGRVTLLIELKKTILSAGSIIGCRIGDYHTTNIKVRALYANGPIAGALIDSKPFLTHTMAVVECLGLKSVQLTNGSNCSLFYTNPSGFVVPADSERPLIILLPQPKMRHSQPYTVLACTAVVYGRPPYLKDWLTYQRVIGIDHVYMIATDSFQDVNDTYITSAVSDGFLTMEIWKEHLTSHGNIRYHSQLLAYQDCIYRFRHSYDYVMMADQDDFFVPLVPNATVHYYINKWCLNKGTCSFRWLEYHPDCGMKDGPAVRGNLTSLLLSKHYTKRVQGKCIHKLSAVKEVGIHKVREYAEGYGEVKVPEEEGYVAHLRKTNTLHPQKC